MIKQYETPQTMRSGSLVHYYIVSRYIRIDRTSDIQYKVYDSKYLNSTIPMKKVSVGMEL